MTHRKDEILIVESDAATAELYQRELSRDYRVFTCASERSALDLLRTRRIRAIVMEPDLDGGQGWQIVAAVKAAVRERPVPIIVCSTLDQRARSRDLGIDVYLVKPTLPVTLRDTVRRVIGRS